MAAVRASFWSAYRRPDTNSGQSPAPQPAPQCARSTRRSVDGRRSHGGRCDITAEKSNGASEHQGRSSGDPNQRSDRASGPKPVSPALCVTEHYRPVDHSSVVSVKFSNLALVSGDRV